MSVRGKLAKPLSSVPPDIVRALEEEFVELGSRFAQRDWSVAGLNGGRFAEAVLRYVEYRSTGGSYTPIGTQLNRRRIIVNAENYTSLPDSLRIDIPRCTEILLDVRNKRDVAHIGTAIDVEEMDAHLVVRVAKWVMAEIVRIEAALPSLEIQGLIDELSAKELPLVEEIEGELIVLATNLRAPAKTLVALYGHYPKPVSVEGLRKAINYANTSRFRSIIIGLQREALVHLNGDELHLTKKGIAWVEANVEMQLVL